MKINKKKGLFLFRMEEKKLKIGIDIDDVILDFVPSFINYYNLRFGSSIILADMVTPNLWEIFVLNKPGFSEMLDEFHETDFYKKMPFVAGFKENLGKLKDFDLQIITSRHDKNKEMTWEWFRKEIPGFNIPILFSGDFYGGALTKEQICNKFGINILIEDHPIYALNCAQNGTKVLLMDKPWNQNCEHENIIRVKNWREILEILK